MFLELFFKTDRHMNRNSYNNSMKIADGAPAHILARNSGDAMTKYLTHQHRQSRLNDICS